MPTCLKCGVAFENFVVIDGKRRNLCKRSYCITCSPFGTNNRIRLHDPDSMRNHVRAESRGKTLCTLCGKRWNDGKLLHCYTCTSRIRRFRLKARAVAILGGKCSRCGWHKNLAGLEFHHARGKDFSIGSATNSKWEKVVEELKKCVLLCANCHRAEHSGKHYTKEFFAAVENYAGRSEEDLDQMMRGALPVARLERNAASGVDTLAQFPLW